MIFYEKVNHSIIIWTRIIAILKYRNFNISIGVTTFIPLFSLKTKHEVIT